MRKYHCTKCNREKVIRHRADELSLPCCDGPNPVKHYAGEAPERPAKPVPPPAQDSEKPAGFKPRSAPAKVNRVTKLDQPAGDLRIGVPQTVNEKVAMENPPAPDSLLPQAESPA